MGEGVKVERRFKSNIYGTTKELDKKKNSSKTACVGHGATKWCRGRKITRGVYDAVDLE